MLAFDSYIFDKVTAREVDENGFLHVSLCNITKEQVAPYYGREIPMYEALGFDANSIYYGYRPAEELQKGASSFNNLPLLDAHIKDGAKRIVGSEIYTNVYAEVSFDFLALEKEYPNFHFHLALDRPDPKADAMGVKYTAGFIAPVLGDTYLKQHDAPEDIEYYLCGPPMMAKTVIDLLDSLGVESKSIMFDNFGA